MINFNEIEKRLDESLKKETPSTLNSFLFEERYGYHIDTCKFDVDFNMDTEAYEISTLDGAYILSLNEIMLDSIAKRGNFDIIDYVFNDFYKSIDEKLLNNKKSIAQIIGYGKENNIYSNIADLKEAA